MTFLNPILASVGLACVAVPILIHILMRRRRKPIQWAAMRFLLEAYRQQRRRLKLEQVLLLAARCLVVALVALALGRPLLGKAGLLGGRGAVTLYLLVDNGLASSATGSSGEGSALDRHKAAAQSLLAQLDATAGDRAALISLGGPAQALVAPASSNTAAVGDLVKGLTATDSPTDIPGAVSLVREALDFRRDEKGGQQVVVILSDFLAGSADTERKLAELGRREDLIVMASSPLPAGPGNISITGLEPLQQLIIAGGQGASAAQSSVTVHLRRTGPASAEAAATSVRLAFQTDAPGGLSAPVTVGQAAVRWAPGQTEATANANVDLGAAARGSGSAVLTGTIDADAIGGDNAWRRPIEVRRSVRVGLVAPRRLGTRPSILQFEPSDWYRFALETADDVEIVEIDPGTLDAARLAGLDGAIIATPEAIPEGSWRRVRAFADSGGLVIVSPPPGGAVHTWTDPFSRDLGLPWTISREPRSWPEPGQAIAGERPQAQGGADLLALLGAEIVELSRPIRVAKALSVETAPGHAAPGTLLALADGTPLLLVAPPGSKEQPALGPAEAAPQRGLVVLLTASLSFPWTDLQAKPLMVPLVQELLRQGVGRARGSWSSLAGLAPPTPSRTVELRGVSDATPATVKAAGERAAEPLRRAGIWRALDETGTSRGLVAVNADPAGARCEAQSPAAIGAWLSSALGGAEVRWLEGDPRLGAGTAAANPSLRSILRRGDDGVRFALPLLLGALAFALLELALARWFSHAIVGQASRLPAAEGGGTAATRGAAA